MPDYIPVYTIKPLVFLNAIGSWFYFRTFRVYYVPSDYCSIKKLLPVTISFEGFLLWPIQSVQYALKRPPRP